MTFFICRKSKIIDHHLFAEKPPSVDDYSAYAYSLAALWTLHMKCNKEANV